MFITQYRFRAPMMRLARLLEGLNSLERGWFYFIFFIIIAIEEVEIAFVT